MIFGHTKVDTGIGTIHTALISSKTVEPMQLESGWSICVSRWWLLVQVIMIVWGKLSVWASWVLKPQVFHRVYEPTILKIGDSLVLAQTFSKGSIRCEVAILPGYCDIPSWMSTLAEYYILTLVHFEFSSGVGVFCWSQYWFVGLTANQISSTLELLPSQSITSTMTSALNWRLWTGGVCDHVERLASCLPRYVRMR